MTVGVLTAFLAYIGRFYTRLDSMSRIVSFTQKAAAGAKRIFDILADLKSYSEWNPFTPRVESTLRPGDPVHLYVRLRGQRLSHRVEYVSRNERASLLCWVTTIGAGFLLRAERCQVLTPIDARRTRFVNQDEIRGWTVLARHRRRMPVLMRARATGVPSGGPAATIAPWLPSTSSTLATRAIESAAACPSCAMGTR